MRMPNLATWMRAKDEPYFQPFFDKHPDIRVCNACNGEVNIEEADGLLLTGGSDVGAEFLRQEIVDPSVIEDVDLVRDCWEFDIIPKGIARGLPIFAICRGLQVLNVALGGTLKLDIAGHRLPEMKDNDIQPLRNDRASEHRFEKVNSSHHQAVDLIADGFEVQAWCATDDIIEQMRLCDYPFALAVQYHPERGQIYDDLFEDFFSRVEHR